MCSLRHRSSICALAIGTLLAGCLENAPTGLAGADEPGDTGYADTGAIWPEPDAPNETCTHDPLADSDLDGLLDVIEDANRNCRVDAGETDPGAADSDGDGLVDGDEDVDRNGEWDGDRGELDPRTADTDQDGVLDGDEPIAGICNSTLVSGLDDPLLISDRVVHVEEYVAFTEPSDTAAWLSLESGGVDWVSIDAGVELAQPAGPGGRRVVFARHDSAAFYEVTEWDSGSSAEFFATATERQLIPTPPETIELGPGPYRVSRHVLPDGRGRVAIRSLDESPARAGATAVAPTATSVVRARCAELVAEPAPNSVDLIFVFATDEETLASAGPVFERLVSAVTEREAAGLQTRIWLVHGDAHVRSSAGAPMGSQGYREAAEVRPALANLEPGDADQRVWMNARAALQSLAMGRLEGTPVLVTLSAREDTEYREGSTEGYDGHAFAEPHPNGERRDSLDAYYGGFFASQVGDAQVHLSAGGCTTERTSPLSAIALAGWSGGTYGDLCAPSHMRDIEEAIALAAGARVVVGSDDDVMFSSVQSLEPVERVPAGPGIGTLPVDAASAAHIGYLYWDAPGLPE